MQPAGESSQRLLVTIVYGVVSVGATELNCSRHAVDSYRGRVGHWAAGREEGGVMELLIQTNRDESRSRTDTHTHIHTDITIFRQYSSR